jgi:hypothetical protein
VDSRAGGYATGVLVLITSAAFAVTLSAYRRRDRMAWAYALITLVFAVTTVANMVERPDGLKIAGCFIAALLIVSLVSRVIRAYELRATGITFDETAAGFLRAAVSSGVINVIANEPNEREYQAKWQEEREVNRIAEDEPTVFLEVSVADASEFEADLEILWGSGEVAPVTREILRRAEPDRPRRPHVHAG